MMATLTVAHAEKTSRLAELAQISITRKSPEYVSMASTSRQVMTNGIKYAANFVKTILNLYPMLISPILQRSMSLSVNGREVTRRNESPRKNRL